MKTSSKNGTALGVTMLFVVTLTMIALSILSLASSTYRLSMRNNVRAESRAVAESELEALYFKFKTEMETGMLPDNLPTALASSTDHLPVPNDLDRTAFLQAHRNAGWRVGRSIQISESFKGRMSGSTKIGTFNNVETRVVVQPPATGPWGQSGVAMRAGRVMTTAHATIFQVCLFYQGTNLELAPNGTTTIEGDIICNGSVFLASAGSGSHLYLPENVYYLQGGVFNKGPGADGILNTDDDVVSLQDPTAPTATGLQPPEWTNGGAANQLKMLGAAENLLGGADASVIQTNNPDLFPTINDVYRSVLVPPPEAGNTNEYSATALAQPDDPVIAAQRTYNKAGLIITVDAAGTATFTKVVNGVSTVVSYADVASAPITMYDAREKRDITITEINIEKLKDFVGVGTGYADFNGLVYVNLKSGNADNPSAVRLIKAETLPKTSADDGGENGGFSLVTNGGLYVRGSYNTTKVEDSTHTNVTAPSMLLADAITVLSDNWDDANAADPVVNNRQAISNDVDADGNPTGWTTINAGLLTGSVPSTDTYSSGGAHNLIRYLEDWYNADQKVKLFGSFGRLFNSKVFTRKWVDPSNEAERYYFQPRQRLLKFDTSMVDDTPPGSPVITDLGRGRFFFW